MPKKSINILISQDVSDAKKLRTIAINKGFTDRKKYIEHLCQREVQNFDGKQLKLKLNS